MALVSPKEILPTRMTLHIPQDTALRLSTLDFPYTKALNTCMTHFEQVYQRQHDHKLPPSLRLPYRQLNNAILALAPGLIQAFEGDRKLGRMVAFTHYDHEIPEDSPTQGQLRSLIRHWLEQWAKQKDVQALLQGDAKRAWQELTQALSDEPETDWQHDNPTPADLAADPGQANSLGFLTLPALLTTLLENQTMVIQSEQGEYLITWRRVNAGGKDGLYLISQPILYDDDYFAYRLDFSVQTQAGYIDSRSKSRPWIFAHLGIQRYITERYRGGDSNRSISILVGFNREHFTDRWENNTTLIRLGAEKNGEGWQWEAGVGALLDNFAIRRMPSPDDILNAPLRYGNYGGAANLAGDEYYVVYAEGRKFGDERERGHQVKTGTSLRERSQIMQSILSLLSDWLEVSPPFQRDVQNPKNTLALRDYGYMVKKRKDNTAQHASWRAALQTSLAGSGYTHLHIAVLHRTADFQGQAKAQIEEALMGMHSGDNPLVTISFVPLPISLYLPLDPGSLAPQNKFKKRGDRPTGFDEQWDAQMRASYPKKRKEWQTFLQSIPWQPNARRLVLIDSTGEYGNKEQGIPDSQKIKGAVRDACNREGILSQFIMGDLAPDPKKSGKLKGESAGRLRHAVLDLLLRQQAILYAPPREIYERAAGLDAKLAQRLDIIVFCRVRRSGLYNFNYVLAVRLRADGTASVMLLGDTSSWIPYDMAAHNLGILFQGGVVSLRNKREVSPLRMKHDTMLNFVHEVLTSRLERPTVAVIEAEGWRDRFGDKTPCWTQLQNGELFQYQHILRFDTYRIYDRAALKLDNLLAVVRLRMDDETPQYITAADWAAEDPMRDIPHLTSYIDPCVSDPLHFMSVAGLPKTQKKQKEKQVVEAFKADIKARQQDEIAIKHPQLIEMVPFFVHPDFQHDEGQRQLCRCIHFLRNSPGFVMGEINLPYPMHLGQCLIEDQLCIIDADA